MEIPAIEELTLLHERMCQAIGEPRRLQIIYALHNRPMYVTEIASELDIPQPTVSRHLGVLRQRGLVSTERDGAAMVYKLTDTRIIDIIESMRAILRDVLASQSTLLAEASDEQER